MIVRVGGKINSQGFRKQSDGGKGNVMDRDTEQRIFGETAMGDSEPSKKIKSPEVMLDLFVSASSSL